MAPAEMGEGSNERGASRGRWVAAAAVLLLLDAVFFVVPLAAALVLYVVLARPAWFRREVDRLYEQ
jgi:hypothetical protein